MLPEKGEPPVSVALTLRAQTPAALANVTVALGPARNRETLS